MSIKVNCINEKLAKQQLKNAPKELQEYVNALEASNERWRFVNDEALKKIREQTKNISSNTVLAKGFVSYQEVEFYLQNKQVYFKKEIVNSDFKIIAESGKVYYIERVNLIRLNKEQIAFSINVNGRETTMYEHKSDLELFGWVKTNFIPVHIMAKKFHCADCSNGQDEFEPDPSCR